jgi:hypothetical protein
MGLKFKNLMKVLRQWHSNMQSLAKKIENNKLIINLFDSLEEFRDLSLEEWNARRTVQQILKFLIQQQKEY